MSIWKQMVWLAKFEYKYIWRHLLLLIPIFLFLIIFIVPSLPEYMNKSYFGIDILFLLAFGIVFGWARPKSFRIDKLDNGLWGSSFQLLLQQLPIKKNVIISYRFLTYTITAILFSTVLLATLYVLTPELRSVMSLGTYVVFSIIWLSFTLYIGSSQIIEEVGSTWRLLMIWSFVLGAIITLAIILVFYKLTSFGVVGWTIFIANEYPIMSVIVSILLTIIGLKYWMFVTRKRMETIDYF